MPSFFCNFCKKIYLQLRPKVEPCSVLLTHSKLLKTHSIPFPVLGEKQLHKDDCIAQRVLLPAPTTPATREYQYYGCCRLKNFTAPGAVLVANSATLKGMSNGISPWSSTSAWLGKPWAGGWTQGVRWVSRRTYVFPELRDEDLEEMHIRGSGPGGQSVNQTANCVVLKHRPSGIVVKCHETRSLEANRQRARERLQEKLDLHLNGENSFLALQKREESAERKRKKRKAQERLAVKKAFKEREGLD